MKVVKDNNFGSERPLPKVYHQDQVEINENIREIEHEEGNYFIADSTYYSYREYVESQDSVIADQKSINEEQDELIAEIIEGM